MSVSSRWSGGKDPCVRPATIKSPPPLGVLTASPYRARSRVVGDESPTPSSSLHSTARRGLCESGPAVSRRYAFPSTRLFGRHSHRETGETTFSGCHLLRNHTASAAALAARKFLRVSWIALERTLFLSHQLPTSK